MSTKHVFNLNIPPQKLTEKSNIQWMHSTILQIMPNTIPSNLQHTSINAKHPKLVPCLLGVKVEILLQGGDPNHPPTHLPQPTSMLQLDGNNWRRRRRRVWTAIHNNQPTTTQQQHDSINTIHSTNQQHDSASASNTSINNVQSQQSLSPTLMQIQMQQQSQVLVDY